MAKRRKLQLNWNGLTLDDLQETVQHFADCEQQYREQIEESRIDPMGVSALRIPYLEKSIRIVQSRQVFWNEMIAVKQRGEKIAPLVRQQVMYARTSGEFNS
jgi:hypothetical protein